MMGKRFATLNIKQEMMEDSNGPRGSQKCVNKVVAKKEEPDAVTILAAAPTTTTTTTTTTSSSQPRQQEESMARRIDPADDLQLMCTKKCIPCHRCGSSMKFFMRRVKYLNTVKEYPAYRCMKKKCQTFRSPRTLARECNMLLRQGFGDGRFMSVAPTSNATRQLKEAFPDHFSRQEIDALPGFPIGFRDDYDTFSTNPLLANSATSNIVREREAWFAMNNAKRSLDALIFAEGGLSLRLLRIIGEIQALAAGFGQFTKKEEQVNSEFESSVQVEGDGMYDLEDEGYDSSLSMRRSGVTDFTSSVLGGDSRSSFDTEMKSETGSVDMNISMKMHSSSALSPTATPVQSLRWINVSRHSPSFGVKMVDGCSTITRRPADQEVLHPVADEPGTGYESLSNCNGKTYEVVEMNRTPSFVNTHDEPSTSYGYNGFTSIATTYSQFPKPGVQLNSNGRGTTNAPVPIYLRPSELCFDDVTESGEILNEFFMPSTLNGQQTNENTDGPGVAEESSAEPVTFAQLWNFSEHYDHKEASPSDCHQKQINTFEVDSATSAL